MAISFPVDSGGVVEVVMNCYPDQQRERPVNAYIIGGGNPALNRSAELGAEIAYERARSLALENENQCYTLGVHLKREDEDVALNGGSGGLAFALAAFTRISGRNYDYDVAATGELAGVGGEVKKIGALEKKMVGLLASLEDGAKIFYPRANGFEMPQALVAGFAGKNITLHPVATVQEALDILLEKSVVEDPEEKSPKNLFAAFWVTLFVCICLAGGLYYYQGASSQSEPVIPVEPPPIEEVVEEEKPSEPEEEKPVSPEISEEVVKEPDSEAERIVPPKKRVPVEKRTFSQGFD